jgi:hypothetical protein
MREWTIERHDISKEIRRETCAIPRRIEALPGNKIALGLMSKSSLRITIDQPDLDVQLYIVTIRGVETCNPLTAFDHIAATSGQQQIAKLDVHIVHASWPATRRRFVNGAMRFRALEAACLRRRRMRHSKKVHKSCTARFRPR